MNGCFLKYENIDYDNSRQIDWIITNINSKITLEGVVVIIGILKSTDHFFLCKKHFSFFNYEKMSDHWYVHNDTIFGLSFDIEKLKENDNFLIYTMFTNFLFLVIDSKNLEKVIVKFNSLSFFTSKFALDRYEEFIITGYEVNQIQCTFVFSSIQNDFCDFVNNITKDKLDQF